MWSCLSPHVQLVDGSEILLNASFYEPNCLPIELSVCPKTVHFFSRKLRQTKILCTPGLEVHCNDNTIISFLSLSYVELKI